MPFTKNPLRFSARANVSKKDPALVLIPTQTVLSFRYDPFTKLSDDEKPNAKWERPKDCLGKLAPKPSVFLGLVELKHAPYFEVAVVGRLDDNHHAVLLAFKADALMADLKKKVPDAQALYRAFIDRERVQLQVDLGNHEYAALFLDLDFHET